MSDVEGTRISSAAEELLAPPPVDAPLPHVRSLELGNGESLDLCWIPPGTCRLGGRERPYADEKPVHKVRVESGFWLGRTPVTRGQWRAIVGDVPAPAFDEMEDPDLHPVVNVSWFDALLACRALQSAHLPSHPPPVGPEDVLRAGEDCRALRWTADPGFRLPSDAEWEYACRGGERLCRGMAERPFGDGEEALEQAAWTFENSAETTYPVTRDPEEGLPPHPFGLRQMIGNVDEWCLDLYFAERWASLRPGAGKWGHGADESDPHTASERIDARGVLSLAEEGRLGAGSKEVVRFYKQFGDHDEGLTQLQNALDAQYSAGRPLRVLRGGSWIGEAAVAASACRSRNRAVGRSRCNGFRVCLSPRPATEPAAAPKRSSAGRAEPGGARSGADPREGAEAGGES